jgi:hypothetical protein
MPTTSEKTEISILEKTEAAIKKTWTGLTSYTQQTITNIKTKCAGYYIESLEKDALAFEEQRLSKVGEYLEFESEIRDVQSKKNILNSEFWLSDIAHRKEALKLVDAQNEIYKKQEINLNDQITLLDLQIEKKKELLRYETDPKKQTSLENEIQRLSGQRAGLSESGKDLGRQQRESYSGLNFDPTSFKDNLQSQMAELYDSFGTLASNMANTITSTVASMKSSMSDFFYDTLTGTKTLKDALASFGKSVAQSMLRAATDSIASFIMRNTVCLALNSAFNLGIIAQNSSANSSMLANEMSTASMTATAWTAPAILKSIATWGVAAAIGVAAIVGVMAAFGGFASGGRVEGKKQLAWFNEDGSEYVVSSKSPRSNDRYFDAANRGVNLDNLMAASPTATGLTSGQNTTRESQPEQRVVKNVTVRSHYELREEMKKAGVVQLVKTSLQREGLI